MTLVAEAANLGACYIGAKIEAWDTESIDRLLTMIDALNDFCEANDLHFDHYVDMSSLPSADIPADVDTGYPVWAMDKHGSMLVGAGEYQTMTLAEYRAD